ncbi:heparinase II/III family protein [Octadecabacter sp. 1_MG-2023]|uniref:heparinase II/III family protein n=1 Tax=unclassified Octadecabacter TaxID=196158 RepID=UPI001C08A514|nr:MULTISPECIES: heparinase II/III family protein [unclassified Octadecabacter]MBU2992107.1 heparinase II/III family protein [Octadecabacter sp. B2R22]MDO6735137.1 heparinase II/III family protein [Octadecabacter sp. 1_MG-2023]
MNRLQARLAARTRPATGFISNPEPKMIGHFARGRQLLAGNFLFSGHLIEAPGVSLWEAAARVDTSTNAAHGFAWLDDMAAVGDSRARVSAQAWLQDWIVRYGDGRGAGWTPDVTGRRLIRWIAHGFFLLRGAEKEQSEAYFRSAAQQAIFLSRRWSAARPGLPRFEALAGMIYAGLALQGMESRVAPAIAVLTRDCKVQIGPDGGIATRNPEELLEVLTLLTWVETALRNADRAVPEALTSAMHRIAPTLRALRHSDGGLARFHGGGRGLDGWLDQALAAVGTLEQPDQSLHMGYGRLTAGRTSLIMDAAAPSSGAASAEAHASTLAMEVTSGRRPLIVNCGPGASFGPEWRRAGRATPSHSTLTIEGLSSSRIKVEKNGAELLLDRPKDVQSEFSELGDGMRLATAHDGYRRTHGLTHVRTLDLTSDGRAIAGEDLLTILDSKDEPIFDKALDAEKLQGIPWSVRFHLHPEVDAVVDLGGAAVSLTQKSGEIWVFRHDGAGDLRLEPSVYLENGRLRPRATQQVVLSGTTLAYSTRIRWSLSKAQETPTALRDVASLSGSET